MNTRLLANRSDRRSFLRAASLLSLANATSLVVGAPNRARATNGPVVSIDPTDDLLYISATKLAGLIRTKKVSAAEAVEAVIARNLEVNDRLNAIIMNCYARARAEARAADVALSRGEIKGPLHGVPMTLKDSIDTEGVITTGATYGRQQYIPAQDATVAARLRAAGAILLGKTNTPEFTLGGLGGISTSSNLLYGSSRNPYDPTRTTSGSSGGAGAIVAAGGSWFDIGSDWGGSIRGPAHANGIAGIKPTSVLVPRTGHIVDYGGVFDLWQQLGPMARRVEDLTLITRLIAGPDFKDAACAPVPWRDPGAVELNKLRVCFFPTNPVTKADADTQATVIAAVKWLEPEVTSVTEDFPHTILEGLYDARRTLTNGDAWAFFKRLADKWGTKNLSPNVRPRFENIIPVSSAEYVEAWERHDLAKSQMLSWFKKYDVLICPTAATPAGLIDGEGGGGGGMGWSYTNPFNTTGWPGTVVRCGTSTDGKKLPIGLQIIAAPWRDDITLAVASFLEAKGGGYQRPPI
jgi:amidase